MRFIVLLAVLSASACATGGALTTLPQPPADDAPLVERDAYYEAKKPIGIAGIPSGVNQLGWFAQTRFPTLVLGDGSRVTNPDALVAAVDASSATAKAARTSSDLRVATNTVYTLAAFGLGVGTTAFLFGPITLNLGDPNLALVVTTLGAGGVLAGAVGFGVAMEMAEEAEAEKMTAFLLYDADLRRRLALVRPGETIEEKWLPPSVTPPPSMAPAAPSPPRARPPPPRSDAPPPPDPSDRSDPSGAPPPDRSAPSDPSDPDG